MKIRSQDKLLLIDTIKVYANYNIITSEKYPIGTYECVRFNIREFQRATYNHSAKSSVERVIILEEEVVRKVMDLMSDFFYENPHGIYTMPTQKEIKEIMIDDYIKKHTTPEITFTRL